VKPIGVLALQGDFDKHKAALEKLDTKAVKVRSPDEISGLSGLIIPGGESTTMGKLLAAFGLLDPLVKSIDEGFPVFGTCAGMILLAHTILEGDKAISRPHLGNMDISVERNAYGRQVESFEATIENGFFEKRAIKAVFIRAPRIKRFGPDVKPLALFEEVPVLVRERNILAASFHPELTDDLRVHEYFLSMI
jgi:5'-phosphate synthase pdxT subunit